jgi:hypothetical protein
VQPGDPRWKPTDIDPVVKQALTDAEKEAARVAAEKAKADADGEADTATKPQGRR